MTAVFAGRPWTGQWIWCQDNGIRKTGEFSAEPDVDVRVHDRRVLFRREFDLADVPRAAPLRVTADSRYVLWVNGFEQSRGPARGHPWRLSYDEVDVADALTPGRNAVAVLVRFYGRPNAWWTPATPTFSHGAGVLVAELDLPTGTLGTDRSWQCRVSPAWTPQVPQGMGATLPEVHDARLLDPDWRRPGHQEPGWAPAKVVTALHLGATGRATPPADPYGPLVPSPLPRVDPVDRRPVTPLPDTIELGADPTVITADWGEIVAGTVAFELTAPPGVEIAVSLAETGAKAAPAIRYTTRGRADRFESADPFGGRYGTVTVTGTGTVTLRDLAVRERNRPRPPGPYFTCSDPVLTEIYEVGLRTVDLCAPDAYVDCPTREQRAWTGDSVVHQSVDLLTNPDWRLATWHPRLAGAPRADGMLPMAVACDFEHRGTSYIPDWSLHWLRSLHNLWRWTGDRDTVADLMPVAENLLRWFTPYVRDGLLTDVTGWVLLDWASVQGRGASAILNGLWGRALRDFAELADWLGDRGRAEWAQARHAELAAAFDAFWDADRGGYRDWLAGQAFSEHAAAAAVVGGLVPNANRAAVLAFLLDRDRLVRRAWSFGMMPLRAAMGPPRPDWDTDHQVVAAQPFFRYVVHDAIAELGAADRIATLCRDWQVFLDAGATTWPETWAGGSRCHGWSSTPSRDLPLYTLGVAPAAPGYAGARIAPRLGELAWAEGAVPTPAGLVRVHADSAEIKVDTPVPAEIDVGGRCHSRPAGSWTVPIDP